MEKNMKRFRKITTAIAVLILLVSAAAALPTATNLGVNDASGDPNTFVKVPVNITNVQGEPIRSIIFKVSFDSSVINLTKSRVKKADLTQDWDSPDYNPLYGNISIVTGDITTLLQQNTSGSVIMLNFSVVGAPGEQTEINISDIQISNETGFGLGTAPAKNGIFKIPEGNIRDNVITLTPVTAQNNVGQNHTVIANVTNSTGAPQNGVLVNFSVISGPNSGVNGSNATNTTGKAKFTYTGSNVTGVDQIKVCFTGQNNTQICSQVVTKEWKPKDVIENDITLTPVTARNIVGQNHTVIANVTNSTGAPQNGILVNFSVISGPNSGVNGSNATNTTGKAKFTYTGSNEGVDQIKACFTGQNNTHICSQNVIKEWRNQTTRNQTRPTEIIDNMTGIPVVNESTINILAEDFMNFTLGDQYNITITRVDDGVVEFNESGSLLGWPKQTVKVNWIPKTKGDYILRSEANTMAGTRTVMVINQKVVSPVPELSTLVLLSAGILGLFGLARRRNS